MIILLTQRRTRARPMRCSQVRELVDGDLEEIVAESTVESNAGCRRKFDVTSCASNIPRTVSKFSSNLGEAMA